MRYYIGIIHKDADNDYGISFPGFACISAGETFEDAMRMGREALALQVEEMLAIGERVPEPEDVTSVMADPIYASGEPVLVGVPYDEIANRNDRRAA